jgi:hypothetical protein
MDHPPSGPVETVIWSAVGVPITVMTPWSNVADTESSRRASSGCNMETSLLWFSAAPPIRRIAYPSQESASADHAIVRAPRVRAHRASR